MYKYINTEQIEQYLHREEHGTPDERWRPESEFARIIDCIPSADVVEIVRCKDCEYWDSKEKVCNHCWGGLENCSENEFCSRGERKETE